MKTGILIDVSGSMENRIKWKEQKIADEEDNKSVSRGELVFDSLFEFVKKNCDDNSMDNQKGKIFILAFGLSDRDHQHCDLMGLFDHLANTYYSRDAAMHMLQSVRIAQHKARNYIKSKFVADHEICTVTGVEPLIRLAEQNGARYTREFIEKHFEADDAGFLFCHFYSRPQLMKSIIRDLPASCKEEAAYKRYITARDAANGAFNLSKDAMRLHGNAVDRLGGSHQYSGGLEKAADVGKAAVGLATLPLGILGAAVSGGVKYGAGLDPDTEAKRVRDRFERAKEQVEQPLYDIMHAPRNARQVKAILNRLETRYPQMTRKDVKNVMFGMNSEEIIKDIKKYIFGGTPMCQSLNYAVNLFENLDTECKDECKDNMLIIVSDGDATDGDPMEQIGKLKARFGDNITVACVFITNEDIERPKRLFYRARDYSAWSEGARKLFQMASYVENTNEALLTLQFKYGWKLAPQQKSKLFVQANHPEVMNQFMEVMHKIERGNNEYDAILDVIGCYNFSKYINSSINEVKNHVSDQGSEQTCYAHATATVFELAMRRIIGRDGGYPSFEQIRRHILRKFNSGIGAKTGEVIKQCCLEYRPLCCTDTKSEHKARQAISEQRPLVARFDLTVVQWQKFEQFFEKNPKAILTKEDLKVSENEYIKYTKDNFGQNAENGRKEIGHAVVLIRFEPDCMVFMNSKGKDWGNGGFFRLQNRSAVKNLEFFDVYWDETELSPTEKQKYKQYYQKLFKDKIESSNLEVEQVMFKCPQCDGCSQVCEYSGTMFDAKCPLCHSNFEPTSRGLVQGMYWKQMN